MNKTFLRTLLLMASLCVAAAAQTLVEDPSGYRVEIPAGLRVRQAAAGVVANDDGGTVGLIVRPHQYPSLEAFVAQSSLQSNGYSLEGQPRMVGQNAVHFRSVKRDPWGGRQVADTFVSFVPGGGCLVVALSDQASAELAYDSAYKVVNSLEFTRR